MGKVVLKIETPLGTIEVEQVQHDQYGHTLEETQKAGIPPKENQPSPEQLKSAPRESPNLKTATELAFLRHLQKG